MVADVAKPLTPEEFAARIRRLPYCSCCVLLKDHPKLLTEVDRAHRESGIGANAMARWLLQVHGVTIERSKISRHWDRQDNGTHV